MKKTGAPAGPEHGVMLETARAFARGDVVVGLRNQGDRLRATMESFAAGVGVSSILVELQALTPEVAAVSPDTPRLQPGVLILMDLDPSYNPTDTALVRDILNARGKGLALTAAGSKPIDLDSTAIVLLSSANDGARAGLEQAAAGLPNITVLKNAKTA